MQIFVLARPETETTYGDERLFVRIDGRLIPLTHSALERLDANAASGRGASVDANRDAVPLKRS